MKRKMKKILTILPLSLILIIISLSLLSCGDNNEQSDNKITVAVTIAPVKTFVEAVGGERVNVVSMVPPGASPETYDPTPKEMTSLAKAKLYFSISVPAEQNIIPSLGDNTAEVKLYEKIREEYPDLMLGDERDPHIWLSVSRVKVMINEICTALSAQDSDGAEYYRKNADSYIKVLDDADATVRSLLSDVKNKNFLVYHPAFGYFAAEYGLNMISLEEEGKEADAKRRIQVINEAKELNIKTIFYQSETPKKQAQSFAEDIGGTAVMLEPLSADYTENLISMARAIAESAKQ